MDTSRRAVEAYWRFRMVDGVTSDEDKVAAVYKLEEICELLRTSHPSIVKETSDYILKRLDHKSPVVKQKSLRLVKYAVGKSGSEFRREMQRHSAAMRQLFHYKGQPDPLKGDSLNKAVRDTAHEAVAAVFAADENKAAASASAEGLNKRIQGFGNTNFEMPTEEKKSFLSEVVGLGSASIKQGLSNIAAAHSVRKTDNGSYKSPPLRRSLTTELDSRRNCEGDSHQSNSWESSDVLRGGASGTWSPDMRAGIASTAASEENSSAQSGVKSREERLLDTIVTSGVVRLQPTRDAIQTFLTQASKLDAVSMAITLEMKIQSHIWQVRMKSLCILESILRKKNEEHFSIISSYFSENRDSVVKCSELPQVSLREKAGKVLSLLEGDQTAGEKGQAESSNAKDVPAPFQMPNLIDTGDPVDYGSEAPNHKQVNHSIASLTTASLVDDLLGSGPIDGQTIAGNTSEHDPFADVAFHVTEDKEYGDIFSGLTVVEERPDVEIDVRPTNMSGFPDMFSDNTMLQGREANERNTNDLMAGLAVNGTTQENHQSGSSGGTSTGVAFFDANSQPSQLRQNGALNGLLGSNTYPSAFIQNNMPQNIMFNQAFATQPINYSAMGAFITQQQLLFQNLGSLNSGFIPPSGTEGGYTSALPDIFQHSNNPVQSQGTLMNNPKKETRAFDFIADHLSASRDSKRAL